MEPDSIYYLYIIMELNRIYLFLQIIVGILLPIPKRFLCRNRKEGNWITDDTSFPFNVPLRSTVR